jgi:hypothetical protein
MNDWELGKREIKREHLGLFLDAHEAATGESFLEMIDSETPDFIGRDALGRVVGIEITQLRFRPDVRSAHCSLHLGRCLRITRSRRSRCACSVTTADYPELRPGCHEDSFDPGREWRAGKRISEHFGLRQDGKSCLRKNGSGRE